MLHFNFKKILSSLMVIGGTLLSANSFAAGNIPESARTALYVNTYSLGEDAFENTIIVLEELDLHKNKETVCVETDIADKCYVQGVKPKGNLVPIVIHWYYDEYKELISVMDQYGDLIPLKENWFITDVVPNDGNKYLSPICWE